MKLNFPYRTNDIVTVYSDWESETTPIGTAKLVEPLRLGRSFILEDTYPENEQIVYNYQEGIVLFNGELIEQKIRYIDTIGIANSEEDEDDEYSYEIPLRDSFIVFNGIEIF